LDWFERLTGFQERDYLETRAKLSVTGSRLVSNVNQKSYGIGSFELVSLSTLRERVTEVRDSGRSKVSLINGEAGALHCARGNEGALFQAASQFNMLEMANPELTPEDGVARYQYDKTQGPACAIAAGAATIYRNYFVPVGPHAGQTKERQIDGLSDLGDALARKLDRPVDQLWKMKNGYAFFDRDGLNDIDDYLRSISETERDDLRARLKIGIHSDVEVTLVERDAHLVSQAFCSAIPVGYNRHIARPWRAFASLVLEATYEATLLSAVLNAARGRSNAVFLTFVGGGVFANEPAWIHDAISRSTGLVIDKALDVRIVCRDRPSELLREMVEAFAVGES
jgi:hypothetical protein